jgi:16S rRNA (cytosine1402-N4)-methyltransferase
MLPNVLLPSATDHVPALAEEVRSALAVEPGQTVVDATFGSGGHAELLVADLDGRGRFVAVDRDPSVRPYFERFARRHGRLQTRFLRGQASIVLAQLAANGVRADAILLDLGVSSMQIDRPERGFSYAVDAPLDMRMDSTADVSARELVNESSERDLALIFRRYGEERYAKPIARAIARRRRERPFERTGDLVETIKAAIPAPARFGDGHPAKRVFQALRIAVNDELAEVEDALPAALEMLRPGGRLAVISFHSLEDRAVKTFLREQERGCDCPPDFPICVCGKEPALRAISRKPIRPTPHEVDRNPRAASARLRAAVKA